MPFPLLFFTLPAVFAVLASSAGDALGPYTQIATIPNAGLASFDISWVDSESGRYYVADRSAGGVDVIDADSDTFVPTVTGFVGNVGSGVSSPNGVLVINKRGELGGGEGHHRKELWAGDGNSTSNDCAETRSWGTAPRAAETMAVEDVYLVRTGRHDCYDRVVFDVNGVIAVAPSLDTVGVLAWTAEDCAILLQAIAGFR